MTDHRALARARTPESTRVLRHVVVLGRGTQLGLDQVPGIRWCRVLDHGSPGVVMPAGQCHVETWGGDVSEVQAAIMLHAPAGVVTTCRVHPVAWWVAIAAWVRWTLWRLMEDPRR